MQNSIVVKIADDKDALSVGELYLASFKHFLPFAKSPYSDKEILAWIANVIIPKGNVTKAVSANKIVGMCATSHDGTYSWIDQLYLAPSHCNQGIGTLLLQEALSRISKPVRLYTFQENAIAISFYEKHNFVAIHYGDGSKNEEGQPDILYELT